MAPAGVIRHAAPRRVSARIQPFRQTAFDAEWLPCDDGSGKAEVVRHMKEWGIGSRTIVKVS